MDDLLEAVRRLLAEASLESVEDARTLRVTAIRKALETANTQVSLTGEAGVRRLTQLVAAIAAGEATGSLADAMPARQLIGLLGDDDTDFWDIVSIVDVAE